MQIIDLTLLPPSSCSVVCSCPIIMFDHCVFLYSHTLTAHIVANLIADRLQNSS